MLKLSASAGSIVRLRRGYDGLEPAVFRDLEVLGGRRRHRRLFEVAYLVQKSGKFSTFFGFLKTASQGLMKVQDDDYFSMFQKMF